MINCTLSKCISNKNGKCVRESKVFVLIKDLYICKDYVEENMFKKLLGKIVERMLNEVAKIKVLTR